MAAAWMFPDSKLQQQLQAWLAEVKLTENWTVRLFVNDYTPIPTSVWSDFVEASFAGYDGIGINMLNWPTPTIVDHVAISTNTTTYTFQAASSGVSPQTVYGYYVGDDGDNLIYAERWTDSYNITNGVKLDLVLKLKHKTASP